MLSDLPKSKLFAVFDLKWVIDLIKVPINVGTKHQEIERRDFPERNRKDVRCRGENDGLPAEAEVN